MNRNTLKVGDAVTLTRELSAYDYRFTIPAGTTGLVGAVRVPCVYYGSGFPGDEFACVDITLSAQDITPAQIEQAHRNAPYRDGETPDGWFLRGFEPEEEPSEHAWTRPQQAYGLRTFRVAAPYDGMVRATRVPYAEQLRDMAEQYPLHWLRTETFDSYPFPWLDGLTKPEARALMERLGAPPEIDPAAQKPAPVRPAPITAPLAAG